MAQRYSEISERLKLFIEAQKMFFVGTASADSRVNVSPKGMDSLRVLSQNRVVWLNVTGSGNETSAHVQELPRMTIMFAAFEGAPMILRLYGTATEITEKILHGNLYTPSFLRYQEPDKFLICRLILYKRPAVWRCLYLIMWKTGNS